MTRPFRYVDEGPFPLTDEEKIKKLAEWMGWDWVDLDPITDMKISGRWHMNGRWVADGDWNPLDSIADAQMLVEHIIKTLNRQIELQLTKEEWKRLNDMDGKGG